MDESDERAWEETPFAAEGHGVGADAPLAALTRSIEHFGRVGHTGKPGPAQRRCDLDGCDEPAALRVNGAARCEAHAEDPGFPLHVGGRDG